ncbi:hypothetical protein [Streptomyces sp. NPDC088794]|uniref:hypothetical protein n=1 Tax=Streptomyces sp. NPDC088794 TaxID=3365902 RepID=UPI003801878E
MTTMDAGVCRRPSRAVLSPAIRWLLIALVLWTVGMTVGQCAPPARCAASAAFLAMRGENRDLVRRRWKAARFAGPHQRFRTPPADC